MEAFDTHVQNIQTCRLCADKFAACAVAIEPRPIEQLSQSAKILIVGQAPGVRAYQSGRPFTDASGVRLRGWMGVDDSVFYDRSKIAVFPMAFCFPGYSNTGSDLPPPRLCATTWRASTLAFMPQIKLTLLVGGYAQKWHLGSTNVTQTVQNWRLHGPDNVPLPHPSWRNTGWIRKNPWFEADLIPNLRSRILEFL